MKIFQSSISFFLFSVVCFLLTSCFQPETGCLDIEASNFDPAADEPCGSGDDGSSCPCKYPIVSIGTIEQDFAKQNFKRNGIYQIGEEYIRIKSIKFFISNVRLIRSDGEYIGVEDTISLTVLNDTNQSITEVFEENFLLISQQTKADIGMIKQSGTYDSIRFSVGITADANTAEPSLVIPTNHPLAQETMHFGSQTEGYIFNQIVLTKDTLTDLTDTIPTEDIIFNIGGNDKLVEVKLPISYKNTSGITFSVGILRIDHAKWFDGINFAAENDALMSEEILKQIVINTPKVFSFSN